MAYAFPKESLLNSAYLQYGELANTPVSPKSWLYEENVVPYNYDPTMAATVLKNKAASRCKKRCQIYHIRKLPAADYHVKTTRCQLFKAGE